jgi:inner membrane protein
LDTGTHVVVGLGLAGLAHIDPAIASDKTTMIAVLLCTVIGSQIPDADGLLRLKSNASYIRNHRGISHCIPAILLYTLVITSVVSSIFPDVSMLRLSFWSGIAVVLHIWSDLFNTYGTQALRPFSNKWISWNIIHIFDPFIFFSHVVAILLWSMRVAPPEILFPILYAILIAYYFWRTWVHDTIEKNLRWYDADYLEGETYLLITTYHLNEWHVLKSKKNGIYALGELKFGQLTWSDEVQCESHPAIEASKSHEDVQAMLYFSNYACASVKMHDWGYEVRWADVRYRHRKQYPFVSVVLLDKQYACLDSYAGWLSESKLEKKLRLN